MSESLGDVSSNRPLLSVAVCTFNRAEMLPDVLNSLVNQTLSNHQFEVLIIDNNSTDRTAEIAQEYCLSHQHFRYLLEESQGLSHARNRAWTESQAPYVAYIDDDAVAAPDWCQKIVCAFENHNPKPYAVGGRIYPRYLSDKPAWFSDRFELRTWGEHAAFVHENRARFGFSGSNMAIQRQLLREFGGFNASFGMRGTEIGLGEEADFFCRVWSQNPGRFWYDPALVVHHRVPARNMTLGYQFKRMYVSGKTGAQIANDPPNGWDHLKTFLNTTKTVFMAPIRAIVSRGPFRQTLVGELRKVVYSLGWLTFRTPIVTRHVVGKRRARLDAHKANLTRIYRQYLETKRYMNLPVQSQTQFHIVSCGRNTGAGVIKCLDSVYAQDFNRLQIRHYFVDDASDDGTGDIIEAWLEKHSGHSVDFHRNTIPKGGTENTRDALRAADPGSIIIELNADDWLSDSNVLAFLSKIYRDPNIWMTYNSFMYSDGGVSERRRPYPKYVIRKRAYRDYEWICQHLHSFRASLLSYLPDEVFRDPETGGFLTKADDRSIYWSLLELCGPHAIHLERIMYVYDFHEQTDYKLDPSGSHRNVAKIQRMRRFDRLKTLEPQAEP